jgi:hypothetical protein
MLKSVNENTNHLTQVPFLVLAGMVIILINNLIIIYQNVTNLYNNIKRIEYILTRLISFQASAWDPLFQKNTNNNIIYSWLCSSLLLAND